MNADGKGRPSEQKKSRMQDAYGRGGKLGVEDPVHPPSNLAWTRGNILKFRRHPQCSGETI